MTMIMVGIAELKAQLSKYVRLASGGEEIGVRDHSKVVARLVQCQEGLPLRARAPTVSLQSVVIPPLKKRKTKVVDVVALLREERGDR
jgi:antitoxin (DNA-binding transcriptional repressor) of toxin-antitoxin stability system